MSAEQFQEKPVGKIEFQGMLSQKDEEGIGEADLERQKEKKEVKTEGSEGSPHKTEKGFGKRFYGERGKGQKRFFLRTDPYGRRIYTKKGKRGKNKQRSIIFFRSMHDDGFKLRRQNTYQEKERGVKPPFSLQPVALFSNYDAE